MARRNSIVVSSAPAGHFLEGYITDDAIKPGTHMERDPDAPEVGGRFGYRRYQSGTDGARATILILLEDALQGRTMETAYNENDRIFLYSPEMGDEMNVLVDDIDGTADDIAIGDKFIVDTETGRLIATTGSPESEPWEAMEAVSNPTADHLVFMRYTGH